MVRVNNNKASKNADASYNFLAENSLFCQPHDYSLSQGRTS